MKLKKTKQFSEILISEGKITPSDLKNALETQKKHGGLIGEILLQKKLITLDDLYTTLAKQFNLAFITENDLLNLTIDQSAIKLVPLKIAYENLVLPIKISDKTFSFAISDPNNEALLVELEIISQALEFGIYVAQPTAIKRAITYFYEESFSKIIKTEVELKAKNIPPKEEREIKNIVFFLKNTEKGGHLKNLLELEGKKIFLPTSSDECKKIIKENEIDLIFVEKMTAAQNEEIIKECPFEVKFIDNISDVVLSEGIALSEMVKFYLNTLDFTFTLLETHYPFVRERAHSRARYAKIISEKLVLTKKTTDTIIIASYFLEIAKIISEKNIEFLEIKENSLSQIALSLSKLLSCPFDIQNIISNLNENYDGSGENSLKERAIPVGARILSVINHFEEEIKSKTDEKIINKERAFRILRFESNKKFDPQIVEHMISIIKEEMDVDKIKTFVDQDAPNILLIDSDSYWSGILKLRLINEGYNATIIQNPNEIGGKDVLDKATLAILSSDYASFSGTLKTKNIPFILTILSSAKDSHFEHIQAEDVVQKGPNIEQFFRHINKIIEKLTKRTQKLFDAAGYFENVGNFYKAGDLYREIGDLHNAGKMYEKALDYNLAAEMYLACGDLSKAAYSYEQGGRLDLAAKYFGEIGNLIKQNELYEKLGNFFEAANNLYNRGRLENAIITLQKIEASSNDFHKAQFLLGKIFFELKKYKLAIDALSKSIAKRPIGSENIEYYYYLAHSYEQIGNYSSAIELFEKILGERYDYLDVLERVDSLRILIEKQKLEEEQAKDIERFIVPSAAIPTQEENSRYKKIHEIGRGGMSVVYKAKDTVLDRAVALKLLSAVFRSDPKVIETFIREAKSAAGLNHVNIVTIYDAGVEESTYFIAMEFIDGSTIKELLKQTALSIPTVLGILKQLLRGLEYAHSKNIIHRDLTTNNLMLTKNRILKIMDFGLARVIKQLMSEQSIIGGTPSYMSPEQVEGDPIDHRSDIYTMGVSLFEMSTRSLPFTKGDLGYHHLHTPPPNPKTLNPDIPDYLNDIILKCLKKKPEDRFQSVDEIIEILENA